MESLSQCDRCRRWNANLFISLVCWRPMTHHSSRPTDRYIDHRRCFSSQKLTVNRYRLLLSNSPSVDRQCWKMWGYESSLSEKQMSSFKRTAIIACCICIDVICVMCLGLWLNINIFFVFLLLHDCCSAFFLQYFEAKLVLVM